MNIGIDPQEDSLLGVDPQVAYDKLVSLDTADEIALFLEGQGVKAIPKSSTECAISNWMTKVTGFETSTAIHVIVYVGKPGSMTIYREWPSTPSMHEFIKKFDTKQYPQLIDPAWDGLNHNFNKKAALND